MAGRKIKSIKVDVQWLESMIGISKAIYHQSADSETVQCQQQTIIDVLRLIASNAEVELNDDNIDKSELNYYRKQAK